MLRQKPMLTNRSQIRSLISQSSIRNLKTVGIGRLPQVGRWANPPCSAQSVPRRRRLVIVVEIGGGDERLVARALIDVASDDAVAVTVVCVAYNHIPDVFAHL